MSFIEILDVVVFCKEVVGKEIVEDFVGLLSYHRGGHIVLNYVTKTPFMTTIKDPDVFPSSVIV
jgi:hypothetical protein